MGNTGLTGTCHAIMSSILRIKTFLGEDIRRLSVPATSSLSELRAALAARYECALDTALKWKDEEGDFITLSSDADLAEALATSPPSLHLYLTAAPSTSS